MLEPVMLEHVMLSNVMLKHVMLEYVYVGACPVGACHVGACHFGVCHVGACHAGACHVEHVMFEHVMFEHVMLDHVRSMFLQTTLLFRALTATTFLRFPSVRNALETIIIRPVERTEALMKFIEQSTEDLMGKFPDHNIVLAGDVNKLPTNEVM